MSQAALSLVQKLVKLYSLVHALEKKEEKKEEAQTPKLFNSTVLYENVASRVEETHFMAAAAGLTDILQLFASEGPGSSDRLRRAENRLGKHGP